jgi:energy-coupling factor transporter ATP-binding protein EcfA2
MRRELESEEDITKLSENWDKDNGDKPRVISRIEDLPDLEQVNGATIQWIVDSIIAEGAVHMLTGESGAGKSTFMTAAAHAISNGLPFMGRATKKRPVLLLDAENPLPAICERFHRLNVKTHQEFRVWGQWVGEDAPSAGGAIVLEWVARCDPKPVIVVDSVIAFHPGTENDSNETRRYMAQYRMLTKMGATVVVLHHIGKSETSKDYRGSSDYKASIDIGYKLTNKGDETRLEVLELRPFKQRFSVGPLLRILYRDGVFIIDQPEVSKSVTETLCDILKANPGCTKSQFEALAAGRNLRRNRARDFLKKGVGRGAVRVERGPNNRELHSWAEKPSE